MIRVYIRDEVEDEGIFLGEFAPTAITALPSLFDMFETVIKGNDGMAHLVGANFVCIPSRGAYFEIVVDRG